MKFGVPEHGSETRAKHAETALEAQAQEELRSRRLGGALVLALRLCWDHLGVVLALSLLGIAAALLALSVGLVLPGFLPAPLRTLCIALATVVVLAPLAAGGFSLADQVAGRRDIAPIHLWEGIRKFGAVALRLGLIHLGVFSIGAVNLLFYLRLGGAVGNLAFLFCLYLLFVWSVMALYQGPLLIAQENGVFDTPEARAKRGAKAVVRRSFFLMLGAPLYAFGLFVAALVWTALAMLTAVGAALLWLGVLVVLLTVPTQALLRRYEVLSVSEDSSTKEA